MVDASACGCPPIELDLAAMLATTTFGRHSVRVTRVLGITNKVHCPEFLGGSAQQCSRKRVQQLEKRKSHVFLDFEKKR